jgi:hypothetical protein
MDIGEAVLALENGARVRRADWNDKSVWLKLQQPDGQSTEPYVSMWIHGDRFAPWRISPSDLLAKDWERAE